jgi:hypothetical protein
MHQTPVAQVDHGRARRIALDKSNRRLLTGPLALSLRAARHGLHLSNPAGGTR